MRSWNLGPGDPLCLTLAADWRLSQIDYTNDHIWELALGRGDPAAILLHGTYGLRARDLRMFPRFTEGSASLSDPAAFDAPPRLTGFAPNWLRLFYAPFPGIEVRTDYWAPGGPLLAGRIQVTNAGVTRRNLRLEWVALLSPIGVEGQAMLPIRREAVHILQGRTQDLWPVLFFTGGPEGIRSPYPALSQDLDLLPGAARRFTWVLASLPDPEEGFRLARQTAARNWEGELARIQMVNSAALVEIATGEPDWDAAFALGQSQAQSLLLNATAHLPYASPVSARQPDHGYSPRGDGSDYNHLWNGQTSLETWYLAQNLLPGSAEAAKGLVRNFLAAQDLDGRIDFKPGLGGQRGRMLATPLLADLAWRIYQHSEDRRFLEEVFPRLVDFAQAWFSPRQDRDGDGVPEWDHPSQSGFDENPLFSPWHAWAQGVDIRVFESPDLCAFLYNECQALARMAAELGRPEPAGLAALAENLRAALETAWDNRAATYRYWDRDAHRSQKGETLGKRKGPGQIPLEVVFDLPQRLALRLETRSPAGASARIYVHGTLPSGQHRVERLTQTAIHWLGGRATLTLDSLFMELDHIQVDDLPPGGTARVTLVDYRAEDHTLLTPLWAGLPEPPRADALIKRKILKPSAYGRPFGLPACLKAPARAEAESLHAAWLPWNVMAAEGLLRYGRRAEAAALLGRLMDAISANLKRERCFRRLYHSADGRGLGERNALLGLPPLGLFLRILGVRIISPSKVAVDGFNPFPWPVQLRYRGLVLEFLENETNVTLPDGQSVSITEAGEHVIEARAAESG